MLLNKRIKLITAHGTNEPHDPRKGYDTTETETFKTVNVTSLSLDKVQRDYGVPNATMKNVRTLTPLGKFDFIEIDGVRYVEFSRQEIGNINSLTIKELNT